MAKYVDVEGEYIQETIGRRAFKTREDIKEWLNQAPTEDVAPIVHAVWEHYDSGEKWGRCDRSRGWYRCSQCKERAQGWCDEDPYYSYPNFTNFCCNCGAKMAEV